MIQPQSTKLTVKPIYGVIRDVRLHIRRVLHGFPVEIIDSAEIVGSELLENAVKYGVSIPEFPEVVFTIESGPSYIRITISNGTAENEHLKFFLDSIEKIQQIQVTKHRGELYIERLQQILENPEDPYSRLGLFRILYETDYNLSYEYKDNVIHLTALSEIW